MPTMAKTKDALEETLSRPEFVNKGSGLVKPEEIENYEKRKKLSW